MKPAVFFRFCLILCTVIIIQHGSAQEFNGGASFGVSATQISGDQLLGFDKAGLFAGFYVNIYISERTAIQMELDYIQKGSRKNPDPEKNDFVSYLLKLQYVDLPVLLKFDYSKSLSFETGPYTGLLMKASEEDHNGIFPNMKEFNKVDVGWIMGIYYHLTDKLSFNFRLSHSLFHVREHSSGATYRLNKGQYNEVLVLSFFLNL